MFSRFGFHHLIFALLPVLFLFLDNIHEIPFDDILFPLLISFLIVVILWLFLKKFIGERKSAVILSLIILLVMIFAFVRSELIYHEIVEIRFLTKNIILIPIFSIIAIFGVFYIKRKNFSSNITSILNVVSITVISMIILNSGIFYMENDLSFQESQKLLDVSIFEANDSIQKPDVYLLLLDAYSGDITLKNDFEFDNSEFYEQLTERGFLVQKDSLSNYPNTALSMPSIMNMNYLDFLPKLQGEESKDLRLAQQLWKENKVMQVFHANEYQIYSFHGRSGSSSDMVSESFCKYEFDLNPELMGALVNHYIPSSLVRITFLETQHYDTITCALDTMINFEKKTDDPIYVHMHIRFPHQPLVFDSDGNKIDEPISTNRFDSKLKDAYLQQLIFANKKTIEIIDSIKQKNSDAIIIVMSDHGGRFGVNWYDPSEIDYFRALSNLNAVYFPGKDHFSMDISPVNLFRIIFNLYFESDYEILEEKQIWYAPAKPFNQTDITEIIMLSNFKK